MLKTQKAPADAQDVELLASLPLFASLSPKELNAIASAGRRVSFAPGASICTEGQSGIGLHVIVSGTVDVTSSHSAPTSLGPGSYFGEIALIDRGPRLATVTAASDVVTFSLVAWEFTTLLDHHPDMVRHLLNVMCGRLRTQAATFSF